MVSRRVVLASSAVVAATAAVGVSQLTGAQAGAKVSTVTVDASGSQGMFPFAPGRQLSAIPSAHRYGPQVTQSLDALGLQRIRVWLKYVAVQGNYASAYEYLDYFHARADVLLVSWRSGYDEFSKVSGFSESAFIAAQRDAIAHYKARYPKIQFIEVENEDFKPGESVSRYYRKYSIMYRAISQINARLSSANKLKIGGPTLDIFSELRLGQFLDAYRADPRRDKQLDFISYHQYLINTGGGDWTATKTNPAAVATERRKVDALLSQRKLPGLPVFITEIGIFPGTRQSSLGLDADLHIQAAALASMHYWYAGQSRIIPFDWTIDHPENDRKDLFVDSQSGVARPYYSMLRMLSMIPIARCRAVSDSLTSQGMGVYGLAGAYSRQVVVATWNYQWTNQTSFNSRVVLNNLPNAFRTSSVQVERYRIANADHSIAAFNSVEKLTISPRTAGTYHGETLPLGANEFRLLVLTATG